MPGRKEIMLKVVLTAARPERPSRAAGGCQSFRGCDERGSPGGGSFMFNITPEGDDVLTHEVATALCIEALERAGGLPGAIATAASL